MEVSKLGDIVCNLPFLQTLHLKNVVLTCVGDAYRSDSSMGPKPLPHLKLTFVNFELPSQPDITVRCGLAELLNLFPSVKTLELSGVMKRTDESDSSGARLDPDIAKAAGRQIARTFRVSEVKATITMRGPTSQVQVLEVLRASGCLKGLQVFVLKANKCAELSSMLGKSACSTVYSLGLSVPPLGVDWPEVSFATARSTVIR